MGKSFVFWSVFLSSLGCAFLMYMLNAFGSVYLSSFACSALFFWLTWVWLTDTDGKGIGCWLVVAGIVLGRIVLELPLRILDFLETMLTMLEPVCSLVSIVLAVICYRRRDLRTGVVSFVVLMLLNSLGQYLWVSADDDYLLSCMATAGCAGLTWLCLTRIKGATPWAVTGALSLGCLCVTIPFYIYNCSGMMEYTFSIICALLAIVLTTICYCEQRRVVYLLSFIILVLLNSFGQYVWLKTSLFIHH